MNVKRIINSIIVSLVVAFLIWVMTVVNTGQGLFGEMPVAFFIAALIGTFFFYHAILICVGLFGK